MENKNFISNKNYLEKRIEDYIAVTGPILPVTSINNIFNDADKVKNAVYNVVDYLQKININDNDRELISSFLEKWKIYGYPTIKQLKVVVSISNFYAKRKNDSKSYKDMRLHRARAAAQNKEENGELEEYHYAVKRKEKNPFRKTSYERKTEYKKTAKLSKQEKESVSCYFQSQKAYKQSKNYAKKAREVIGLFPLLEPNERKVVKIYYKTGCFTKVADRIHLSRTRACQIVRKAFEKLKCKYYKKYGVPLTENTFNLK